MVSRKCNGFLVIAVVAFMLLAVVGTSHAVAGNSRFVVVASHTPEECLKVLDEVSAKEGNLLKKLDWGCMAGDHTGYCVMEAKDEAAVKAMLPEGMKNAKIVKLNKFTAEQIKSFHEKK